MSLAQFRKIVRRAIPNAERIRPVGYSIAERFPQFEYMADYCIGGEYFVCGITASLEVVPFFAGCSLDL